MQHVAVAFGGPSSEHDISILTGLQATRLISQAGEQVLPLYWDRAGAWHVAPAESEARDFIDGAPKQAIRVEPVLGPEGGWRTTRGLRPKHHRPDAVLSCFHGGYAEAGGARAIFDSMALPSTGGSIYAGALSVDKLSFAATMASAGLPTLPRVALGKGFREPDFDGPYIVKPRFGGSSIGIEIVEDLATATGLTKQSVHLTSGAVIEPYRPDLYDLNIAVVTFPDFRTSLIEKPIREGDDSFYSYRDKYLHESGLNRAPREMPAPISDDLADRIRSLAEQVSDLVGLGSLARLDFLSDGDDVFVNEVNNIPGAMSLYLWPDESPSKLLLGAVDEAVANFRAGQEVAAFARGEALRAAGGIAGKLANLGRTPQ
jgi:D-alanine-D-alanine ligase